MKNSAMRLVSVGKDVPPALTVITFNIPVIAPIKMPNAPYILLKLQVSIFVMVFRFFMFLPPFFLG